MECGASGRNPTFNFLFETSHPDGNHCHTVHQLPFLGACVRLLKVETSFQARFSIFRRMSIPSVSFGSVRFEVVILAGSCDNGRVIMEGLKLR